MTTAVFQPDPLLSRVTPQGGDGFGAASLLAPQRPIFQAHPVMAGRQVVSMFDGVKALAAPAESLGLADRPGDEAAGAALGFEADGGPAGGVVAAVADPDEPVAWEAQLQLRYREGFEEGLAEGARLAAEAHEVPGPVVESGGAAGRDAVLLLEALSRALQPLLLPDDASTRFEPLKRLALHLAMELVRTELSVSPRVVEALVLRSVQALQAGDQSPLVVELHPLDLALIRSVLGDPSSGLAADAPLIQRVQWKEDAQLSRGSVRARSDVSAVEDLIELRLATIMQDLRIQSGQWQRDEAALQAALAEPLAPPVPQAPEAQENDGDV